jgi:hypothetical protein
LPARDGDGDVFVASHETKGRRGNGWILSRKVCLDVRGLTPEKLPFGAGAAGQGIC